MILILLQKELQVLLRRYDGKIVSILEGGYNLNAFKESIEAHVGALL